MGLIDDLSDNSNFAIPKRAWCSVCELLKTLNKAELVALSDRLNDKNITHIAISTVLKKNGYNISDQTVGRHRRGTCNVAK